ncbi:EAL domain-containing protein [Roseomonas sp. OT10]|uniref:putative bifunctional diguanylate cyclase/phosphodiesterase n=1 Tax=Roseomonas cutis TaxID=2897332 RepID=UPI001E3EF023|nr:EAL domain-containing protein [Roseomonas sp. OT10]UFN47865.1 EAL domain-containing protein [Roseomonas sp. OT10]
MAGRLILTALLPGWAAGLLAGSLAAMLWCGAHSAGMTADLAFLLDPGPAVAALVLASLAATLLAGHRAALRLTRPLQRLAQRLRQPPGGEAPPLLGGEAPPELVALAAASAPLHAAAAERDRLEERLRHIAQYDSLTGLPNRALLRDRLQVAVGLAERTGQALAVLSLDLDRFQAVNDTLGSAAGDALLCQVAERLRGCLRGSDTLARSGGDSFVLVAHGLGEPAGLSALADRILAILAQPFEVSGEACLLGVSLGAAIRGAGSLPALTPAMAEEMVAELLRGAELALHQAKMDGRGRLRVFAPDMDERLRRRRAMVQDMRAAIARGEFRLAFQPQVCVASGRVMGAEALLRWTHPVHGPIPPDSFIPVAEESGLIVPLGAWVLAEACRVAAGWPDLSVAVNVSPIQVRQAGFVATVEQALARSGLPPERLELEITEAVMLAHTAETLGTLSRLRALGVRLAMDDFGTGYSSFATLQRFRFDKIKVDRAFIGDLGHDERALALLRALVGMGSALGVITNAEGVEEESQFALLRAEGVQEAQGYLFGAPMAPQAFDALLRQPARALA